MTNNQLKDNIENCTACSYYKLGDTPLCGISKLQDIDYERTDLMVITDKPSVEENELNWSWGDRHSRYLVELLNKKFHNIYYTYLVKCYIGNKQIGKKNTKTCIEHNLKYEIELYKPERILILGERTSEIYGGAVTEIKVVNGIITGFYSHPTQLYNYGTKMTDAFHRFLNYLKEGKLQ